MTNNTITYTFIYVVSDEVADDMCISALSSNLRLEIRFASRKLVGYIPVHPAQYPEPAPKLVAN